MNRRVVAWSTATRRLCYPRSSVCATYCAVRIGAPSRCVTRFTRQLPRCRAAHHNGTWFKLAASRSGTSDRYRVGMARRKSKQATTTHATKVKKALRNAIRIADDALDKIKDRPKKTTRPNRKH